MREIWNKLAEKASDAGEFVEGVTKSGIRFLRSRVGRIPLFTSTADDDIDKDLEVDETHYLRVSLQALLSVYEEALEKKDIPASLQLHKADLQWFEHLRELQGTLWGMIRPLTLDSPLLPSVAALPSAIAQKKVSSRAQIPQFFPL